jgi:VWFA-related protein
MLRPCRRLSILALLGGLLWVATASSASFHGLASQAPDRRSSSQVFRSAVDAVLLNVTVVNAEQRYVTDLDAGEFSIFEDGVKQQPTFFSRAQLPIALSLLIDTSVSMVDQLPVAQEAAIGFVRHLRAEDVAQIVDFDSRVKIMQSFTNRALALERAIRATQAGGATALYNALYVSLKQLAQVNSPGIPNVRRRAIVLLSDGKDNSSLVTYDELLELAKRSDATIHAIGLRSSRTGSLNASGEADVVLRRLSHETGGRSHFPRRIQDLERVYVEVADELSNQYVIGYASSNPRRDGTWRRIEVSVTRPNVAARTRRGYYAGGSAGVP